jgi:hypothetical protein
VGLALACTRKSVPELEDLVESVHGSPGVGETEVLGGRFHLRVAGTDLDLSRGTFSLPWFDLFLALQIHYCDAYLEWIFSW